MGSSQILLNQHLSHSGFNFKWVRRLNITVKYPFKSILYFLFLPYLLSTFDYKTKHTNLVLDDYSTE